MRDLQRALGGGCGILQEDARFADVLQATAGIAIEAASQETLNGWWRRIVESGPVDVLAEHRRDGIGHVIAGECPAPRQHLVKHGAKGPDVAPSIRLATASLLGTEVRRRAENHPVLASERCS